MGFSALILTSLSSQARVVVVEPRPVLVVPAPVVIVEPRPLAVTPPVVVVEPRPAVVVGGPVVRRGLLR